MSYTCSGSCPLGCHCRFAVCTKPPPASGYTASERFFGSAATSAARDDRARCASDAFARRVARPASRRRPSTRRAARIMSGDIAAKADAASPAVAIQPAANAAATGRVMAPPNVRRRNRPACGVVVRFRFVTGTPLPGRQREHGRPCAAARDGRRLGKNTEAPAARVRMPARMLVRRALTAAALVACLVPGMPVRDERRRRGGRPRPQLRRTVRLAGSFRDRVRVRRRRVERAVRRRHGAAARRHGRRRAPAAVLARREAPRVRVDAARRGRHLRAHARRRHAAARHARRSAARRERMVARRALRVLLVVVAQHRVRRATCTASRWTAVRRCACCTKTT